MCGSIWKPARIRYTASWCVVALVFGIVLSLALVPVISRAVSEPGKPSPPPKGRIIYASKTGSGHKHGLFLADWPDPKPKQVKPKVIGKYGLGDLVDSTEFSPDGTKVLFAANRVLPNGKQVEADGVEGMDLWILDISKNTVRPLTTDGASYSFVLWSPNGQYICAVSHEGVWPTAPPNEGEEELNLYVWDVGTGKRTFLSHDVNGVVWSRDSNYLYYEGEDNKWGPSVLRIPRHGGKSELIQGQVTWIGWVSPNGKYITLPGSKLGIKTLGSNEIRYFLSQISPVTQFDHLWAPDSRRIAVRDVTYDGYPQKARLMILDTATGKTRILDDKHNQGGLVAWSQDGNWLVVTRSANGEETSGGTFDIVCTQTGKAVTLLGTMETTGFDWHELPSK